MSQDEKLPETFPLPTSDDNDSDGSDTSTDAPSTDAPSTYKLVLTSTAESKTKERMEKLQELVKRLEVKCNELTKSVKPISSQRPNRS